METKHGRGIGICAYHPTTFQDEVVFNTKPTQTGVFSVTVAAFIIVSYQSLQPDSADATVRLLSQISQQLTALSNGTPLPAPLILPDAASFKPTPSAVRVNVLWFVSLSMSTACALWATLMQQWARRYVQVADRPYITVEQARIRAYFLKGVEDFGLATAVEVLPVLLHSSVLLFYIGLIDFLLNINFTVGVTLLSLVALLVLVYFILSIMPLCFHNSPYLTPLSAIIWFVLEAVPLIKLWFHTRSEQVQRNMEARLERLKQGMDLAFSVTGAEQSWEMDHKSLQGTLLSLDGDHKLEDFLDGLQDLFRTTSLCTKQLRISLEPHIVRVSRELLSTCSQLPDSARRQRLSVCLGTIWSFPETMKQHFNAVRDRWHNKGADDPWGHLSTETWEMATKMTGDSDPFTALHAYCVQALIAVMRRHKRWECHKSEWATQLQLQLRISPIVIDRHLNSKANHLQLAVAANLFTNALRLLPDIDDKNGTATLLKVEVKAILDSMCHELDVSDVPEDLHIPFVDAAKVSAVFRVRDPALRGRGAHQSRIDIMTGSWTKLFAPGTTYETGQDGTGRKSIHPTKFTARLEHLIHRDNLL